MLKTLQTNKNFIIIFLLTSLVLFLRIWERFLFPGVWAEDGTLFLRDSIFIGIKSIFNSYGGYFHTFPRIISILVYWLFPIVAYPIILMILCTLFYVIAISQIYSDEFSDFLENRKIRILLILLLCLVPGLNEILGNLANLHWILFLYLAIYTLKNLESKISNLELVFIFFILASTGEPIVLIPVLSIRIFLLYKRKNKVLVIKNGIILLFIILFAVLNLTQKNLELKKEKSSTEEIKIATMMTLSQYYIFQPVMGEKNLTKFYDRQRTLYFYLGMSLFCFLIFLVIYYKLYSNNLLFPLLFCVFSIAILNWIVRPGSLLQYIDIYSIWNMRYSFVLSPWGLILWVKLISSIQKNPLQTRVLILFAILYFYFSSYRFFLKPYDKTNNWFENSKILDSALKTGCPKELSVPINPKLINPIMQTTTQFYIHLKFENDKVCE